jgi:hypothetical protein
MTSPLGSQVYAVSRENAARCTLDRWAAPSRGGVRTTCGSNGYGNQETVVAENYVGAEHRINFKDTTVLEADHSGQAVLGIVFARSNVGIVGSNPTRGMDFCCVYFVFVLFCV